MLASASGHLTEPFLLPTGRRLNAVPLLIAVLLGLALMATPSSAAADYWWAASAAQRPSVPPAHIFGVGDSVMLGASSELTQAVPGIEIDAVVGRQASAGIDILRARAAQG